jgi:hypothetical protein
VNLLGSIDQQKEQRECARGDCGYIERQFRGFVDQRVQIARARRSTASRFACTPQIVHDVIRFVTFEAPDDVAQSSGEETNVVVERNVLGPRVGIPRN